MAARSAVALYSLLLYAVHSHRLLMNSDNAFVMHQDALNATHADLAPKSWDSEAFSSFTKRRTINFTTVLYATIETHGEWFDSERDIDGNSTNVDPLSQHIDFSSVGQNSKQGDPLGNHVLPTSVLDTSQPGGMRLDETIVPGSGPKASANELLKEEGIKHLKGSNGQHYNVDKKRILGQGQYGKVYQATNSENTEETWAVKVITSKTLQSLDAATIATLKKEFEMQAQVTNFAKAQHIEPLVIELHDHFKSRDGTSFYVMEYAEGGDLETFLKQSQSHVNDENGDAIRGLCCQLAWGLRQIHDAGVVHLDIKPANIVIVLSDLKSWRLKYTDFGFASHFVPKTATLRSAAGTPYYLSPEIVKAIDKGTPYEGPEVDIWALGVIFYMMATGKKPFVVEKGKGFPELKQKIAKGLPGKDPNLDTIPAQFDNFKVLIRNMLKLEPDDRWTLEQITNSEWLKGCTF